MADAPAETLYRAAAAVEIVDVAGRILSNPRRHAPSATAAETLALAFAVEKLIDIALEAELLARAVREDLSPNTEDGPDLVGRLMRHSRSVLDQVAAIRVADKQTQTGDENGSLHS